MSKDSQTGYKRIYIAGLPVDCLKKEEVLNVLIQRTQNSEKTFVMTPYSEFLHQALIKPEVLEIYNKADISLADGVGILFAEYFLGLKFFTNNFYMRVGEGFVQIVWSLVRTLVLPGGVSRNIPERISGSVFTWDVLKLAEQKRMSVYFLGGFGDTSEKVVARVTKQLPQLVIAGHAAEFTEQEIKADIVLVAFGPLRQETFIVEHKQKINSSIFIGVGGTFDYIAGNKSQPHAFIRKRGFEWLYRLITQPQRLKRIINATFGMLTALLRYKVFQSMPLRKNVMCVVVCKEQILVCKRKPEDSRKFGVGSEDHWQLPQGGINSYEDVRSAASRELLEETGINAPVFRMSDQVYTYEWSNGKRNLLGAAMWHYRGQEQQIAYFRVAELPKVILEEDEFIDYKWVNISELKANLHPVRHKSADIVLEDLRKFL